MALSLLSVCEASAIARDFDTRVLQRHATAKCWAASASVLTALQWAKFLPSLDKPHGCVHEEFSGPPPLFHSRFVRITLAPGPSRGHFCGGSMFSSLLRLQALCKKY